MKLGKYTGVLGCTRSLGNLHPEEQKMNKEGSHRAPRTKPVEKRMRKAAAALPLDIWHSKK